MRVFVLMTCIVSSLPTSSPPSTFMSSLYFWYITWCVWCFSFSCVLNYTFVMWRSIFTSLLNIFISFYFLFTFMGWAFIRSGLRRVGGVGIIGMDKGGGRKLMSHWRGGGKGVDELFFSKEKNATLQTFFSPFFFHFFLDALDGLCVLHMYLLLPHTPPFCIFLRLHRLSTVTGWFVFFGESDK